MQADKHDILVQADAGAEAEFPGEVIGREADRGGDIIRGDGVHIVFADIPGSLQDLEVIGPDIRCGTRIEGADPRTVEQQDVEQAAAEERGEGIPACILGSQVRDDLFHIRFGRFRNPEDAGFGEKTLPAGHTGEDILRDVFPAEKDDRAQAGTVKVPGVMKRHRRDEDEIPGVQVAEALIDEDPAFPAVDIIQLVAAVAVVAGHDKAGVAHVGFRVDPVGSVNSEGRIVRHFFLSRQCWKICIIWKS